jgi:hypothetical protein
MGNAIEGAVAALEAEREEHATAVAEIDDLLPLLRKRVNGAAPRAVVPAARTHTNTSAPQKRGRPAKAKPAPAAQRGGRARPEGTRTARVLRFVQQLKEPLPTAAIAKHLQLDQKQLGVLLWKLHKRGDITRVSSGVYGPITSGAAARQPQIVSKGNQLHRIKPFGTGYRCDDCLQDQPLKTAFSAVCPG